MASSTLDAAMSTAGVTGVVCIDAGGMCLRARGDVNPEASGFLRGLSSKAASLGNAGEQPVIVIDTGTRFVNTAILRC